jgi:hypothetical protein
VTTFCAVALIGLAVEQVSKPQIQRFGPIGRSLSEHEITPDVTTERLRRGRILRLVAQDAPVVARRSDWRMKAGEIAGEARSGVALRSLWADR